MRQTLNTAWGLLASAAAASMIPTTATAQVACPRARMLPAYAHNDYLNSRPLHQALELGYRGVEADLVLRGGELRVAHDPRKARVGRTLETMYLRPARTILQHCGRVLNAPTPLLLNVELKERDREAYDSLLALVSRYPELFDARSFDRQAAVEIILVGWWPAQAEPPRLGRQQRITRLPSASSRAHVAAGTRLVSLDYGKTIGWSGRGPVPQHAALWLHHLRQLKESGSRPIARAYDVPVHPAVYRLLLDGGVDLIGSKDLVATERVLRLIAAD